MEITALLNTNEQALAPWGDRTVQEPSNDAFDNTQHMETERLKGIEKVIPTSRLSMKDVDSAQYFSVLKKPWIKKSNKTHAEKLMSMASLDLSTQQNLRSHHQFRNHQRPKVQDLSMNRIMKELETSQQAAVQSSRPMFSVHSSAPSSSVQLLSNLRHLPKSLERASANSVVFQKQQPQQPLNIPEQENHFLHTEKKTETTGELTRRRRIRNGLTPLTESEKRVKQRQLVKRSYYRKIDTLRELREEMDKLEKAYQSVVSHQRELEQTAQRHEEWRTTTSDKQMLTTCDEIRHQYRMLAISKDELRQENEQLRVIAAEQSKVRTRVGILVNEELQDISKMSKQCPQTPKSMRTAAKAAISPTSSEEKLFNKFNETGEPFASCSSSTSPVVHMTPMTEEECMAIVQKSFIEIRKFQESQNYDTTGAVVLGWRDRRKIQGDELHFGLEKTFFGHTAEQVSSKVWKVLSTDVDLNRIYRSNMSIKFQTVQIVNDNNVVFYRTIEREGFDVVVKALVLASRIEIDNGYMILFRSIDSTSRNLHIEMNTKRTDYGSKTVMTPNKKEIWGDVFSFGLYEQVGAHGEHCRNFFGGFVAKLTGTNLQFWLMHVLLIAVRCEMEAIGPLFIMPANHNDKHADEDSKYSHEHM